MKTKTIFLALLLITGLSARGQTIFRGFVVDGQSKQPISNAKIGITNQGVGVLSNEYGKYAYKKYQEVLSDTDRLIVSALGYETITIGAPEVRLLLNKNSTIKLDKSSYKVEVPTFKKVKIFWDISEGLQDRIIDKDLASITQFLNTHSDVSVELEVFNDKIVSKESWKKWDGDMNRLRESVTRITYDGPSNYNKLLLDEADAVILVSNGDPNYGKLLVSQDIPVFVASSTSSESGIEYLKQLVRYTSGAILNEKENRVTGSLDNVLDKEIVTSITGKITSLGKPVQGAIITKKGDLAEYRTKADGSFKLPASDGDILLVRALGMFPKGVAVKNSKNIAVDMIPSSDQLDEVVIRGKEKIFVGKKIVEGTNEPNMPGGVTELGDFYITDKDIIPNGKTVGEVLRDKFKGVMLSYTRYGEVLTIFGKEPVWYVNGLRIGPGEPIPFYIPDNKILSIIVKDGPASNIKYGGDGELIPGIQILITTKDFRKDFKGSSLLVTNNTYTETVPTIDASKNNDYQQEGLGISNATPTITGTVKGPKGLISDASVTKKGSFNEVSTNPKGRFTINAALGDVLIVSASGMFIKELLIENQDVGTIQLTPKTNDLDAIVLEGQERVDNTVQTADGEINADRLGYAVETLEGNDFSSGYTNLRQLITGKIAGVSVVGGLYSGSDDVYKIRGGSQSINTEKPPIWIINGTPYQDAPNFLDVQQIKSITVLKSAMATSRYGSLAAGGAFLIKTKEVDFKNKAAASNQSALVSGNEYTGDVTGNIDAALPSYILRFRESGTPQQQLALYKKLSRTQESPLEYYVDAARYFQDIAPDLGDEVRSDLAYIARNNSKALRTLAYLYELVDDTEKVVLVAERLVKIAPQEAQSYRDLALAYQNNKQFDKALELYINMLGEQIMGVNFAGLEKPLKSELSRLVALHKDKIDYRRLPNEWLRADFKRDMRMVIEWSDRSVPFEFQFVNPDKKFFKWTHTLEESRERLQMEQSQGFQTEEFIIDDAPSGEWIINIQYLGDEGDYALPPFLKYTVFRDYGTLNETKDSRIIKLFKQKEKVTLGRLTI